MQALWIHRGIRYTETACIFNDPPRRRVTVPAKEIATLGSFHLLNTALNSDRFTRKETLKWYKGDVTSDVFYQNVGYSESFSNYLQV